MSQTSEIKTITDAASLIITGNGNIKTLNITNTGTSVVYIGTDGSALDSTGFPVHASEVLAANDYIGDWYGICTGSETSTLRIDIEEV